MRKTHLRIVALGSLLLASLVGPAALAHNVAQIDTAIYFDRSTQDMLLARAQGGGGGIQDGDVLTYIIEFLPVANGATVGAGGYVTAYIPPGVEVVGADFVIPDGSGDFAPSTPNFPGETWTDSPGFNTFDGYTTSNPDASGVAGLGPVTSAACLAAGGGAPDEIIECNGRMMEIYADTGAFFSTDPRTALFVGPDTDGIARTTNGYHVEPSAEGGLTGLLGVAEGRVHNLWDAEQCNAFDGAPALADVPRSPQINYASRGTTPFNAGSAVAGPDSGYWLDQRGEVGPWRRIRTLGGTVGTNSNGPADRGAANTPAFTGAVTNGGLVASTAPGQSLSASRVGGTVNAVRWAVGRLNVGEIRFVRLAVRVQGAPPAAGIQINTEVYGGDAAAGDNNKDAVWRYMVPSLAQGRALDLFVRLEPITVTPVAGAPFPYGGSPIPPDATVRYRLTYGNFGIATHTDVVLTVDTPPETAGCPIPTASVTANPATPLPYSPTCETTLRDDDVITFATIPTLASGESGVIEFDLVTNSGDRDIVITEATIDSFESLAPQLTRSALPVIDDAYLQVTATGVPSPTVPGTIVNYTITVANVGFDDASQINLSYILPAIAAGVPSRFSFVPGSSVITDLRFAAAIPTLSNPPTFPAFAAEPRDELVWDWTNPVLFPLAVLPPGESFDIQIQAVIGDEIPSSLVPYYSASSIVFDNGNVSDYILTNAAQAPILVVYQDWDEDGTNDDLDPDDDNDGILDVDEVMGFLGDPGDDTDLDGVPDWADPDHVPGGCPAAGTPRVCTTLPAEIDADGDGNPNHLDRDSDGDGITDTMEVTPSSDSDGDEILDGCVDVLPGPPDGLCDSGTFVAADLVNSDPAVDGTPDFLDLDSDGDGIFDAVEAHDADGDGNPEFASHASDHDGDGIDDAYDADCLAAGSPAGCAGPGDAATVPFDAGRDSDGNGVPDWRQVCRDGYQTGSEPCDDGNTENSADECSNACLLNTGFGPCEPTSTTQQCVSMLCDTTTVATGVCQDCVDDTMGVTSVDTGCMTPSGVPTCDTTAAIVGPPGVNVCEPCVDTVTGSAQDDGCTTLAAPICDVSPVFPVPNRCVPCLDTMTGTGVDDGCATSTTGSFCLVNTADATMNTCGTCEDSDPADGTDDGCDTTTRFCDVVGISGARTCERCEDSSATGTDFGCMGSTNICDERTAFDNIHRCVECQDTDPSTGTDDGCGRDPTLPFCRTPGGAGTDPVCCECLTNADCSGGTPVCDGCTCVPTCTTDVDCNGTPAMPRCLVTTTPSRCVTCREDADCNGNPLGEVCDNMPEATAPFVCRECLDTMTGGGTDRGCMMADPVCDDSGGAVTATCEVCEDTVPDNGLDDGCMATLPICDEMATGGRRCVQCLNDGQCPAGGVCTSSGLCGCEDTAPGNGLDDGCVATLPICEAGGTPAAHCEICNDSTDGSGLDDGCTAATPVCNEPAADAPGDHTCGECFMDSHCPDGACDLTTNTCGGGPDTDRDGKPDEIDIDDDDDGILDTVECGGADCSIDTDMDGTPDYADVDESSCADGNNDGVCDQLPESVDFDGDGVPNHLDLDSDGDGVPDSIEGHDVDSDGVADVAFSGNDADDDELDDAWDTDLGASPATTPDHDGDGSPDYLDVDSDGDGIEDFVEANDANTDGVADTARSGTDANMNGIDDAFDTTNGGTAPVQQDTDGDGNVDYLDVDSDGDGIPDRVECPDAASCTDTDEDDTPDYLELDADGDGIPDATEGHDVDRDGRPDSPPSGRDTDGDGLDDAYDGDSGGTPAPTPDTDGDDAPDYQDVDDDGDTLLTMDECPEPTMPCPDGDSDGIPDYLEPPSLALSGGALCAASPARSGGSGALWLAGLLLLGLLFRRRSSGTKGGRKAALAVGLALAASFGGVSAARAQSVTLDHFRPAETPEDGFAISRPDDMGHVRFGAQLSLDYAYNPLVVEGVAGDPSSEVASIIEHQLAAHIGVSFGLWNRVLAYVQLPVNLVMDGTQVMGLPPADGASLGDLLLGLRGRIYGEADDPFAIGLQLGVTVPSAAAAQAVAWAGESGATFHPELLLEGRFSPVRITGNLGVRARTSGAESFPSVAIGHELTWGLGLTTEAVEDMLDVHAEVWGASSFEGTTADGQSQGFGTTSSSPIEALVGFRVGPFEGIRPGLSLGLGLVRGLGAPDFRGVLTVSYVGPEPEEEAEVVEEAPDPGPQDRDRDGIFDNVDQCPDEPEDMDEFEDEDGCPDPDNDADGILDVDDECPMQPEDIDQFEDENGCPDPDNDSDGILDAPDECPNEPEDIDQFEDENGCPDPDNDQDTVPDAVDECPLTPGLPEDNGCNRQVEVDVETGAIRILERVEFATNRDEVLPGSIPILEAVLSVLAANPRIERVRVEGHTDDRGRDSRNMDLSQRRAASVRLWLITHGLAESRMESHGCGELHAIESNRTSGGRQNNRRVEFQILLPLPPSGLTHMVRGEDGELVSAPGLREGCLAADGVAPRDYHPERE